MSIVASQIFGPPTGLAVIAFGMAIFMSGIADTTGFVFAAGFLVGGVAIVLHFVTILSPTGVRHLAFWRRSWAVDQIQGVEKIPIRVVYNPDGPVHQLAVVVDGATHGIWNVTSRRIGGSESLEWLIGDLRRLWLENDSGRQLPRSWFCR